MGEQMKNSSKDAGLTDKGIGISSQSSAPKSVWLLIDQHGRPAKFKLGDYGVLHEQDVDQWLWLTRRESVIAVFLAKDDALKFASGSHVPKEVVCTVAG